MFACTKKCHAAICKAYKVLDDRKLLGTMMERTVMTTQTTWTIYKLNILQVRATTPDSKMERQAQQVQGKKM